MKPELFNPGLIYAKANSSTEPSRAEDEMRYSLLKDKEVQNAKQNKKTLATMDGFDEYIHSVDFDKKKVKTESQKDTGAKSLQGELLADIMAFRMNDYGWLGDNTKITQTSEFDDRFNHADLVCEFDNRESGEENVAPTFLAIDCTVTEDHEVLEKKIGFTSRRFRDMEMLPDIKYHRKNDGKAGIKSIPRVIVAIEKKRLDEVCKSMLLADNGNESAISKTRTSYLQLYMLYEIGAQLNKQLHYVAEKFQSRAKQVHAFESLSRTYATIQKIIEQKESSLGIKTTERAWEEFNASEIAMYLATDDLSLVA